ncbi:MAG: divergent polysaccharide deacetylase family protein [Acidobacteriota bacterium]|nr:divergent polysaccharide deacetylase family protein [Acidobacteriota bacterium]
MATLKITVLIGVITSCCGGCQRARHKQLPEGEIHRITQEFVFAANSVAPTGSEVHGEVGAFDKVANSADHIEIRIFEKRGEKAYPAPVTQMLQKFNGIATAHGLTQDGPTENGNAIIVNYRHAGFISHIIHIHLVGSNEARERETVPAGSEERQTPRLAIILDDMGNDREAAEAIFAMPYPLTLAILPNQMHSLEALRETLPQTQSQGVRLVFASELAR